MTDEFLDAVNHPDPIVRFVRLHQFLDRTLSALINERLIVSHYLDIERIPFNLKVELAVALGVVALDDRATLQQFNGIRNRMVHEPKTVLTNRDAADFFNICGVELRHISQKDLNSFDDPTTFIGEMVACLWLKLDKHLEHLRDVKLWERAAKEELEAAIERSPGVKKFLERTRSQPDPDILKRFERLKAESSILNEPPDEKNAP